MQCCSGIAGVLWGDSVNMCEHGVGGCKVARHHRAESGRVFVVLSLSAVGSSVVASALLCVALSAWQPPAVELTVFTPEPVFYIDPFILNS